MKTRFAIVALGFLAAVAAIPALPSDAAAQCKWGCKCMDNARGCNSNGNGGSCDAGGTGCVVSGCLPVKIGSNSAGRTVELEFTADGAVVQVVHAPRAVDARSITLASFTPAAARPAGRRGVQELGGRWEYVAPGRAVARHCSGMVVARYFDRDAADAARKRSRTIRI
jgi:hypothetical protein